MKTYSQNHFSGACGWQLGLALLISCLTVGLASADEEAVAPAQIAEWIAQLDDDLYDLRKSAQQRLESLGQPALEAITEEARTGSLESSTRALNIMLAWTESPDHDLQIAALKKLVTLPNRPIESGLAAELLADAHERAAFKAFTELGGQFEADRFARMIDRRLAIQVIVDADWKGELEGLEHLAAMRSATAVSFYVASVGDGALQYLARMPNLRRIEFFGTKVSEETIQELEKQIPNILIDVRQSGAFLGISGPRQGPVVIETVSPGSAASAAGLLPRDTVTELEGEKIKDFRDLTQRISQFQPGETVELTILRAGKSIKKQVTFDRWGKQDKKKANGAAHHVFPVPRKITLERR